MNLPVFRIPARPSFVVAVAACLMSAGVARARVFETYGQCLERYGKPATTVKTDIGSNVAFLKNDVSVTVEFRKDTAVSVTYFKVPVKDRRRPTAGSRRRRSAGCSSPTAAGANGTRTKRHERQAVLENR